LEQANIYRILPGNIRDVSVFGIAVKESDINNAVVVADKGFGSEWKHILKMPPLVGPGCQELQFFEQYGKTENISYTPCQTGSSPQREALLRID
jgi:hypothetical protein